MNTPFVFIGVVVILVVLYEMWRIMQKPVIVTVTPQQANSMKPVKRTIVITPDQEKQYNGRDYVIAITEPSLSPVDITIVRSSTNTQTSVKYERPANGFLSTRLLIDQGVMLHAPFPITLQIQWNVINSQTMQIVPSNRWWQL